MDAAAARAEAERARRREQASRWLVPISAAVIAVLAIGISVSSATTRADDVANRLAEPVAQRVLALGRADSARGTRGDLDAANVVLAGRRLPLFAQPPPDAPNWLVARQEARAWAMVDYPEELAEQVRDEVRRGKRPGTQPIVAAAPDPSTNGDVVVTTIPLTPPGPTLVDLPPPSSAAPTGRNPAIPPAGGPTSRAPASGAPAPTAPPPATSPNRGGLLPLLPDLPIRVPLLSE